MQPCKTCSFFKDLTDKGPIDWGECRQNAPVPVTKAHDPEAKWPRVKATDGCGKGIDRSGKVPAQGTTQTYLLMQSANLDKRITSLEQQGITTKWIDQAVRQLQADQYLPWWKRLFARS